MKVPCPDHGMIEVRWPGSRKEWLHLPAQCHWYACIPSAETRNGPWGLEAEVTWNGQWGLESEVDSKADEWVQVIHPLDTPGDVVRSVLPPGTVLLDRSESNGAPLECRDPPARPR